MECFVDELPKDCIECPFCQDIKVNAGMDRLLFCKANKGKAIKNIEKSFDKCIVKNEFQSFTDYTKQVRKELCEKIKEKLRKQYPTVYANIGESLFCSDCYLRIRELSEVLDQLEEYKEKL